MVQLLVVNDADVNISLESAAGDTIIHDFTTGVGKSGFSQFMAENLLTGKRAVRNTFSNLLVIEQMLLGKRTVKDLLNRLSAE